ncbi:maltose ABC transporter membrane protein /trehalose ABC transporter membrane protein /sucrose ABC transporter membrane protein /palatinose ABC transporter membrane protein [Deinococcus reticulitermitis]|uniref:Maltose ABC transporter membrane protein /trehalose ABC transporter membrane protein /sucrose ABC transporter membrane protein /palatinose ABC transporter membrane protein n=1 Tax=Deinococcus reticulitermitis TaxID=856736 RepID=A0A1H7ACE8_9DEIO|nr:sugar ABC transporter permease [Deinococcus reticulitermitis]SEJ63299.1 maltose ABC transporter membrane protein /trehalose ABC transporter membrane protein /sucrose ABC transporter membrane protein /palatinose ABC transporter membrane protein [Deinococcus reticulitermitis]
MTTPPTTDKPVSAPPPVRGGSLEKTRARIAVLMLIPMLIVLAAVAGYPLLRTIYLSFTEYNFISDPAPRWIGLGNYWLTTEDGVGLGVLQTPEWWQAVWNTVKFSVLSVTLETVLGLAFALVINSNFKGRGLMRTAILVPWAIPTVVSAQMWNWMYNDSFGILSQWGQSLGFLQAGESFLSRPDTALAALVAVDVWKTTPFMALLLLAGLQSIPSDMYEAADVDGASPWVKFWRLTLPLLTPALLVALIFRTLDALRVFDMPYIVKGNAPETITMSIYARQELISNSQFGFGSAISVLIFLIIMVFTAIYVTSLRVKFD